MNTVPEASPALMPQRRREHPVVRPESVVYEFATDYCIAVAYRREMIDVRGVPAETAEVVLRTAVWMRDGGRCRYCGRQVELRQGVDVLRQDRMTFDHVVPLSRGGEHTYANVWTSCRECNSLKGDKTLAEFDAWLLSQF